MLCDLSTLKNLVRQLLGCGNLGLAIYAMGSGVVQVQCSAPCRPCMTVINRFRCRAAWCPGALAWPRTVPASRA